MTYGSAGSVQSEMNPMATEWTQETVLRFLTERGGRVRNGDLIDNFRAAIPTDPKSKTAAKEAFKRCVDTVAFVKVENGEKYVCLKKKFRGWDENSNGHVQDTGSIVHPQRCVVGDGSGPDGVVLVKLREEDHEKTVLTQCCPGMTETDEDGDAKQKMLPAVDCGTDRAGDAQPPAIIWESLSVETAEARVSRTEMGNRSTCISEGMEHESGGKTLQTGGSAALEMSVPEMVVTECPVPVETDGAEMIPPQPACSPTSGSRFVCELKPPEEENPARRGSQCFRRRSSRGSQRGDPSDGGADEGRLDPAVTSGGDGSTPKGSRENFIKHMMISSPQVRRSMVLRNSVHLPAKCKDPLSECDFCGAEDESAAVTLDPLEHEWMMCASDGEWENLHRLLTSDPNLITKKDFVTGFTCLHWAAKLGRPELVAVLVNFAKKHGVMVNINVRSSIIFYEDKNFQGRWYVSSGDCADLTIYLSSCCSCRVESGYFMVYDQPNFKGNQYFVRVGAYSHYQCMGMVDSIRSCRMIPPHRGAFRIRIYERENFGGQKYEVTEDCDSFLERYHLSEMQSCHVTDGHWLVYEQPHYKGRMVFLRPGEYRSLREFGPSSPVKFSSMRRITDSCH
ncbi:uncharacterized protein LOC143522042 [Brachyhypopomus gauderio]|uniref:uncharacterized protein LOC143522042 n=1 Tax=Brachyhypopomus gauderio TaxID=698409 RepID=UPI0040437E2B